MTEKIWYVYIARANDDTLYTGMSTNPKRRIREHNASNRLGAKALRGKRPVELVYTERYNTSSEARKREIAIKRRKRDYRLKLVEQGSQK